MVVDESATEAAEQPQSGLAAVGARLAGARKKEQLAVDAVAGALHLTVEVVKALEAGDEARLPAIAFVRGYVKSYARLVGLDETTLLARLPGIDEQRPRALKHVGMRRRGRRLSLPLGKWLLWLLLAGGLVGVFVYGVPLVERLWSTPAAGPEAQEDRLPLPAFDEEELSPPEGAATEEAPPLEETVSASEPVAPETVLEIPVEEEAAAAAAPAPATEAAVAEEGTAGAERSQVAGPAEVHLRFNEDSWVEMDANGRKLVVGNQRAGSERTVRAEPPIHVLLGNAPGVELSYRGRPVDLTPYSRGKVARLTLED